MEEKLKHAEEQWRLALDKNELYDVMYWRGVIDGLKMKNTERYVLAELYQAMKRD